MYDSRLISKKLSIRDQFSTGIDKSIVAIRNPTFHIGGVRKMPIKI
jgi:hypothetical protein